MRLTHIIASAALFGGCIKATEDSSEVKWAHISYAQAGGGNWLIDVLPNETITICGEETAEALKAVKTWSDVLGRTPYLKFVDCPGGQAPAGAHKVTIRRSSCTGVAYVTPGDQTMTLCSDVAKAPIASVMLHEFGHLWGLCDLYDGGYEYCDKQNDTGNEKEAIMKTGGLTLLDDDKAGVKALAERSDIPGNKKWKDFLASQPPVPTSPTTPGTPSPPTSNDSNLYLAIEEFNPSSVRVHLSAPLDVQTIALCNGSVDICKANPNAALAFGLSTTTGTRKIYTSTTNFLPVSGQVLTLMSWDANNVLKAATEVHLTKNP